MKILLSFSVFLFIQLSTTTAFASDILNFSCGDFPPFTIKNKNIPGIDIEIITAALTSVGRTAEYKFYPFKRAYELVKNGQADSLCGCSYRPEREKHFVFSDLIGNLSQGIFLNSTYAGSPIKSLQDLNTLSVATVRGYALQKELNNAGIKNLGVLDDHQLLTMLLNKRIDAIYAYRDVVQYKQKMMNVAENLTYFEISTQPTYVCISRTIPNSESLERDISRGLRIIRENGTYQKIENKYFPRN